MEKSNESKSQQEARSAREREYHNFWSELKLSTEKSLKINIGNAPTGSHYQINTGVGDIHFEWRFHPNPRTKLGVEIHFQRSELRTNEYNLEILKPSLTIFETMVGEKADIETGENDSWKRVCFKIDLDNGDIDDPKVKEFGKKMMIKMYNHFMPVIEKERNNFS